MSNEVFKEVAKGLMELDDYAIMDLLRRILDEELAGAKIISNAPKSAWSSTHVVVFSLGDKFFKFEYDQDSWVEDHSLGECYSPQVTEVFPVERTVIVYE